MKMPKKHLISLGKCITALVLMTQLIGCNDEVAGIDRGGAPVTGGNTQSSLAVIQSSSSVPLVMSSLSFSSSSSSPAEPVSWVAQGPINGFGSVILYGDRYDTTGANFWRNGEAASEADFEVGDMVTVIGYEYDGLYYAEHVYYQSAISGVIDSYDYDSGVVTLLGQRVLLDAGTVVSEELNLRHLRGKNVRLSGWINNGEVTATRMTTNDPQSVEISGHIRNIDTNKGTFIVGNMIVDYSLLDNAPALTEGDLVNVTGQLVRAVKEKADDETVGRKKANTQTAGDKTTVGDKTVNAEATISNETTDLETTDFEATDGEKVAESIDPPDQEPDRAPPGDLNLQADRIQKINLDVFSDTDTVVLSGFVRNIATAGYFTTNGVKVNFDASTVVENGRIQDITADVFVTVRGEAIKSAPQSVSQESIMANSIYINSLDDIVLSSGAITAVEQINDQTVITIEDQAIALSAATAVVDLGMVDEGEERLRINAASLAVGDFVVVEAVVVEAVVAEAVVAEAEPAADVQSKLYATTVKRTQKTVNDRLFTEDDAPAYEWFFTPSGVHPTDEFENVLGADQFERVNVSGSRIFTASGLELRYRSTTVAIDRSGKVYSKEEALELLENSGSEKIWLNYQADSRDPQIWLDKLVILPGFDGEHVEIPRP